VGLWAQNVARKPIGWKWSGSNTRASDFIKAMKEVSSELNVPFIDIYHMTLPVLDANRDGVHFNESVTRTIAMLMVKNMQESYSFAASN
jgi:FMN-dependent NADH-azoreductase